MEDVSETKTWTEKNGHTTTTYETQAVSQQEHTAVISKEHLSKVNAKPSDSFTSSTWKI